MSSIFDKTECPNCGKYALTKTDTHTMESHTYCSVCGYDSDIDDGLEDYYEDCEQCLDDEPDLDIEWFDD